MSTMSSTAPKLGRPRKTSGQPTRDRLLDSALALFAEKGFAATTVREIAEAVGIRDSAIYAHFKGKQDIFEALLETAGPGLFWQSGVDLDRLAERDPADALRDLYDRMIEVWDTPRLRRLASVVMREDASSLAGVVPQVEAILRAPFERWMAQGVMRDDTPADLLIWELVSPFVAIRMIYLNAQASEAERALGKRLAARHLDYFIATVVRPPKASAPR